MKKKQNKAHLTPYDPEINNVNIFACLLVYIVWLDDFM